jgi:hypothetical protein
MAPSSIQITSVYTVASWKRAGTSLMVIFRTSRWSRSYNPDILDATRISGSPSSIVGRSGPFSRPMLQSTSASMAARTSAATRLRR